MENRRRLREASGARSLYVVPAGARRGRGDGEGRRRARGDRPQEGGRPGLRPSRARRWPSSWRTACRCWSPIRARRLRRRSRAGWRGVVAGVAPAASPAWSRPSAAGPRAAGGPWGPPSAAAASRWAGGGGSLRRGLPRRPRLGDHPRARRRATAHRSAERPALQLEAAGLAPRHIEASEACTRCDPARFYSYRRDNDPPPASTWPSSPGGAEGARYAISGTLEGFQTSRDGLRRRSRLRPYALRCPAGRCGSARAARR
jgi:hypothetical protein